MGARTYSIGDLAVRTSVSRQTLRHYHKLGLLHPSTITPAGYRRYSTADIARLEVIRTLREFGFDLAAIGRLLERTTQPGDALHVRIAAVEAQIRELQWQRTVLTAAARRTSIDPLAVLQQLGVLARLTKSEREAFLASQLGWRQQGSPGESSVWAAAVRDLPETLDDLQMEVWLELAQLASDSGFQHTLQRHWELGRRLDTRQRRSWASLWRYVMSRAAEMIDAGVKPESARAQAVVEKWLEKLAAALRRKPGKAFETWFCKEFPSYFDPRIERYWQLIRQLKGDSKPWPAARAWDWCVKALRVRCVSC